MTVFNTDGPGWGSNRKSDTPCTICNKRLRLPYVEWQGTDLFICAPCCRTIRRGLMADMVQAAAIADLHDLGYREQTLIRSTWSRVNAAERAEECAGRMMMEKFTGKK